MIAAALFLTLIISILIGIPIAVALILGGALPLATLIDLPMTMVAQKLYASLDTFTFLAIPFFVLSGNIMARGGVSRRLVRFASSLVGWMPGGLAVVTFVVCAFFGAICGSSSATIAAIGVLMVPAMLEAGYDLKFTLATVASAGWLGVIIPPSIPMIMFALSAGSVSIGDLFMGGFIPGIMLAALMSIYAIYWGKKNIKERQKFRLKEVFASFADAAWALGMPVIILGGIYSGIFTATESAAIAVVYGVLVGKFVYKELKMKDMVEVIKASAVTTSVLMFIVVGASVFSYIMTVQRIPVVVAEWIVSFADTRTEFIIVTIIIILIVGTFMETAPAMMVMAPILVPMLGQYGMEVVPYGVCMAVGLGIGMVTPPVGVNLYVTASITNNSPEKVINKHLFIYAGLALIGLVVLYFVPELITFLPNAMR